MDPQAKEALHRIARAVRMAEVLKECGCNSEKASTMMEIDWEMTAAAAATLGQEPPFIPCSVTRELTIGALRIAAGGIL